MSVLYTPHALQIEAHKSDAKTKILFWGRQVGKSFWSINDALLNALLHQGTYFMIFSTYKQAHDVIWREFMSIMPPELAKIVKTNEADLTIEFPYFKGPFAYPGLGWQAVIHDPDKPKSLIQLLGSDQATSHRGRHCSGQYFDEYAFQDPQWLSSVYSPMLATTNGFQTFMSTPNGFNHWYNMVENAKDDPDIFFSKATWRDNPLVSREFVEKERKKADQDGEMSKFLAEYELQFRTVEGPVYPDFDRNLHVIDAYDVPLEGTLYIGSDPGFENPFGVVFIWIDGEDNWYIIDELYRTHTLVEDIIPMIRDKLGDKRLALMVADSQASEAIAQLQKHFPVAPVKKGKDSIPEGIRLVTSRLRPRQRLTGMPRPKLFVTKNCKHFIYEMDQYHYPEHKQERNPNEQPVKKDDHLMDALRYVALHFKYGQAAAANDTINTHIKFNDYGMLS